MSDETVGLREKLEKIRAEAPTRVMMDEWTGVDIAEMIDDALALLPTEGKLEWKEGVIRCPDCGYQRSEATRCPTCKKLSCCPTCKKPSMRPMAKVATPQESADVERLRSALEPLATTKCSNETAAKIESATIVQTGNGEFAAHVARLLTDYAEAARAALNTETDG